MTRRYQSGTRWCAWRWTDVILGGLLYLRRLHLIQTPWFSIMLHWIVRPDPQPDMHDHPVSFLSIPLRGWYVERRGLLGVFRHAVGNGAPTVWNNGELYVPSPFNVVRATDRPGGRHRIEQVSPGGCLTLVFAGPVVRRWGFHTAAGWIPWREYSQ